MLAAGRMNESIGVTRHPIKSACRTSPPNPIRPILPNFVHDPLDTAASIRHASEFPDTEKTLNRLIKTFGFICLAGSASGCGTFMNTVGYKNVPENRVYCGERSDVDGGSKAVRRGLDGDEPIPEVAGTTILSLIDLPLSLAADTLTLPWVAYRQISPPPESESAATKDKDKKVDDQGPKVQGSKMN